MIEELLNARLLTLASNVYPNVAPLNYKTPCVVYQRLETEALNDLDGFADQAFVTFQLSISSTVFGEAKTLARKIRNNLRDWNDAQVQTTAWINEVVAVDNTTETQLHRVMLFFQFFAVE